MEIVLKEITEKYQISRLIENLEKNKEIKKITIGILGETSAGKSSMINALIEEDILPTNVVVATTKSITMIDVCGQEELTGIEYYKDENGEIIESYQTEFEDICLGKQSGIGILRIPQKKYLNKSVRIVDTPGLGAITKEDTEITNEFLSHIDFAVICMDSVGGGLTKGLSDFMRNPNFRNLVNKSLFVLTKGDLQPQLKERVEFIRKTLKNDTPVGSKFEERIFGFSTKDDESLLLLNQKINDSINTSWNELISHRSKILNLELINDLLNTLKSIEENYEIGDEKQRENIEILDKEIENLKKRKEEIDQKLENCSTNIEAEVKRITEEYKRQINAIKNADKDKLSQFLNNYHEEMTKAINKTINNEAMNIEIKNGDLILPDDFLQKLSMQQEYSQIISQALTAVLFTIAIPGGAFWGNLGQFMLGVLLQDDPKIHYQFKGKEQKFKYYIKKFKVVEKRKEWISRINPIGRTAEFILERWQQKQTLDFMDNLPEIITHRVINEVKVYFEENQFIPLEKELMLKKVNTEEYKTKYRETISNNRDYLDELKLDIRKLEGLRDKA